MTPTKGARPSFPFLLRGYEPGSSAIAGQVLSYGGVPLLFPPPFSPIRRGRRGRCCAGARGRVCCGTTVSPDMTMGMVAFLSFFFFQMLYKAVQLYAHGNHPRSPLWTTLPSPLLFLVFFSFRPRRSRRFFNKFQSRPAGRQRPAPFCGAH